MYKIVYNKKTNKYRLIDATLTPGDQMWCLVAIAAAATTYSDEVQPQQQQKATQFKHENCTKESKLHFSDLQYIYICIYASYICYS